ncbi:UDP-N-acetylmuramoyl-L-alanine--D-glutamate ligase [Alteriqipengyuania lutimaris]|uniref:UDP-N-acetylmuramoylalanine--D-glutamate ligase n=1 Tax=Alteriqipengyuania lutimaris TaxID=1538146 RepID=A0A395LPT8_9SPHN|nr:UDP-N-acetylmuramoyl-L-alanine--D-glutamate ligase [Alteriqipengyuania lutimaris]MBB3033391.1 UDP-N-acetylmuramoylalanine--D-glutamate ligase [Alteriqipengyuania lutimaris]RDS77584.1 UDP-N-acetylmuramoyl-L-alanine--D-glutamate ligase [Alteriqipengyuania lutimaris]
MITNPAWKGRKYAVLGLARSGRATVNALLAAGADVTAWDERDDARAFFEGRVTLADPVEVDLTGFDGVVVSPGVPLNTHPIKPHADRFGVPVIGDIELFAQARETLPPHKVVGITGTNGKSTTTALVHHILKEAGVPTTMGGNIGLPILEQEPLPEGGVYVLELSSYQIDLTFSLACDVAVLLNITPDHLDRYDSFEAYAASKSRLLAMQTQGQNSIARFTDARLLGQFAEGSIASILEDVLENRGFEAGDRDDWPSLQGPHNRENAAAAIEVADILGLSEGQIRGGLRTFPGLPHRMERVGELGGVLYVNDSKATNTAAAAPALAAFEKIHWIVGGKAKEPGLGETEQHMHRVTAAYTIGEAGDAFAEALMPHCAVSRCGTLEKAVELASQVARGGETVLLSPACASFDQFRDFEDRGDQFRTLVHAITFREGI